MIVPFAKIKLPARLSVGFYGKCCVQFTQQDYRHLADETTFDLLVERDITENTLPTYSYLRRLASEVSFHNGFAMLETASLEVLSRLRLIKYFIYAFRKQYQ